MLYKLMKHKVTLSKRAASQIYKIIKDKSNFFLKLRLYVIGGGCSGFQYGFEFSEKQNIDDTIIQNEYKDYNKNVKIILLIDFISVQYLKNAKIDYIEKLQGSYFTVKNPNIKTTCGCGSSFSI